MADYGTVMKDETSEELCKIFRGLQKKLPPETLNKFNGSKSIPEQVSLLFDNDIVQKVLTVQMSHTPKSLKKAKSLRVEGNSFFKKRELEKALSSYNEAVLLAPAQVGEEDLDNELALVLANRSAVLYHRGEYDLCLRDIEAAIKENYPQKLMHKLLDRKKKCHARLDKATDKQDVTNRQFKVPELSHPAHPVYEGASVALDIAYCPHEGRYARAAVDIRVGDVLAVERPLAAVLASDLARSHCQHCFLVVRVPLPCRGCAGVIYCSQQCAETSWQAYHRYECHYLHWLSESWSGKLGALALRLAIVTAEHILQQDNQGRKSYEKDNHTAVNGKTPKGPLSQNGRYRNSYETLCGLVSHSEERDPSTNFQMTAMAVFLSYVLKRSLKDLGSSLEVTSQRRLAIQLAQYLQIIQCNGFALAEMQVDPDFRRCKPLDIGLGLYTVSALVNHSCDPTLDSTYYGTTSVYRAMRDIQAGGHVTLDYGPIFYSQSKVERQDILRTHYYFTCQCAACVNDWPLWHALEAKLPTFQCPCGVAIKDMPSDKSNVCCSSCGQQLDLVAEVRRLQTSHEDYAVATELAMAGDYLSALPALQDHLSLLQRLIVPPWREFFSCQVTIKQCYRMMANSNRAPEG